jgi:hypothetical protein
MRKPACLTPFTQRHMSDQSFSDAPVDGAPAVPPATPTSWWEDYIDIFYAPASVFRRRAHSGFAIPMLVVTVLIALIFFANRNALQPVMDGEMQRGFASAIKQGKMTQEQASTATAMSGKFAPIALIFITPLTIFFIGLIIWGVGKLFDAATSFGAAIMIAAYAYVPRVLESVINGVQALLLDPTMMTGRLRLSLGAGRFFDPDTASPVLLAAVGRIDLFTIWVTILIAIGLSVTGKIPRGKAYLAAAVIWIVGGLYGLVGALRA